MSAGWFRIPAPVRDWAVALAVATALVVAGLSADGRPGGVGVLGIVLLAVGGLALAAGRRAPRSVLVVTGLCAVGHQAAGFDVPAVAFLVAVHVAMRAGHRVATAAAGVTMLAALPFAALAGAPDVGTAFEQGRSALELAWLIAAAAAGEALRQAERRADEAERSREEVAARRADEERLHIARELHDSLTHQISVVTVQADVAVHLANRRGEEVSEALLAIQQAGRAAARDLRATLTALRDDGTARTHGLADVPGLVAGARSIGLDATLVVDGAGLDGGGLDEVGLDGAGFGVPRAVGRTAYRIVQESLTNVARHARATTAAVRIDLRAGRLAVQVDDDGCAVPGVVPVLGMGLLGMQERVAALGGRLHAAPRDEGGFRVRAELPLDGAS